MADLPIVISEDRVTDYCRRWKVAEMVIFGSALREDFGPDSDIDILVSFKADARWGLFDLVRMEEELEALLGRAVDLATPSRGAEREHHPAQEYPRQLGGHLCCAMRPICWTS